MQEYTCPCCGRRLDDIPLDVGFNRPDALLRIPEHERETRSKANSDYCVIDGRLFFIRCFLPVRILETNKVFGWGFWCKISAEDFARYRGMADVDGSASPPFRGFLANAAKGYDDIEGLPVEVQTGPADERPTLTLLPCNHLLHFEQLRGITMRRVHEVSSTLFPDRS